MSKTCLLAPAAPTGPPNPNPPYGFILGLKNAKNMSPWIVSPDRALKPRGLKGLKNGKWKQKRLPALVAPTGPPSPPYGLIWGRKK